MYCLAMKLHILLDFDVTEGDAVYGSDGGDQMLNDHMNFSQ